jgi:hypothetical protein
MIHHHTTSRRIKFSALIFSLLVCLIACAIPAGAQTSKPCPPTTTRPCSEATILNCTSTNVLVSFRLCCNGEQVISSYINVPPSPCPIVAAVHDFSPCTIIGVYNIISAGKITVQNWNPADCTLTLSN